MQTRARAVRERMVQKLADGSLLARYGISVDLSEALRRGCVDDAEGNLLDAVLAAVQAAWSWVRRKDGYGVPQDCDLLEGWIVDPVTQPSVNSSITRVRPVFRKLFGEDSTGTSWLPQILRLSKPSTVSGAMLSEPGSMLPAVARKRPYADPIQGAIGLERCFEFFVAPGKSFLRWLLAHPDRLTWPESHGRRVTYWHAAVRRETIDHPEHAAAIEDECSICHMPMARPRAGALGLEGRVFANLPRSGGGDTLEAQLAADGVSCTVCHQISDERLGTPESFGGGFVMAAPAADGSRSIAGPFEVNDGHTALMRSATGAQPTEAAHIRQSELCATCHTLTTEAFDADGNVVGSLNRCPTRNGSTAPSVAEEVGCQSCHMPAVGTRRRSRRAKKNDPGWGSSRIRLALSHLVSHPKTFGRAQRVCGCIARPAMPPPTRRSSAARSAAGAGSPSSISPGPIRAGRPGTTGSGPLAGPRAPPAISGSIATATRWRRRRPGRGSR